MCLWLGNAGVYNTIFIQADYRQSKNNVASLRGIGCNLGFCQITAEICDYICALYIIYIDMQVQPVLTQQQTVINIGSDFCRTW